MQYVCGKVVVFLAFQKTSVFDKKITYDDVIKIFTNFRSKSQVCENLAL